MNQEESTLLGQLVAELERITVAQHELAKRKRLLAEAATQLRLGQSAEVVLARITPKTEGAPAPF